MTTAARLDGHAAAAAGQEQGPQPGHGSLLERVVEATRYSVRDVELMAAKAARSRMYNLDESQAFTLMMIAESEGLHPVQALKRYHVIEGRPSMRADAMQAEFQRHGGHLRWLETTAEACEAEAWHLLLHPEHLTFRVTLRELVESRVACVWDKEKREFRVKDMYRKFPRQMLRARVISEIVRAIDPGIVVGIYTPEEISDFASGDRERGPDAVAIERPAGPTLVHEPNHEPKAQHVSEARQFVRAAVAAANDRLRNILLVEGKADGFEPVANESQVVQWMIGRWIEDGVLAEADVLKPNGSRDPAKVGAAFQVGFRQDTDEVRSDVWSYLCGKARKAAAAAGVELPDEEPGLPPALAGRPARAGDSDEAQGMADEDAAG